MQRSIAVIIVASVFLMAGVVVTFLFTGFFESFTSDIDQKKDSSLCPVQAQKFENGNLESSEVDRRCISYLDEGERGTVIAEKAGVPTG